MAARSYESCLCDLHKCIIYLLPDKRNKKVKPLSGYSHKLSLDDLLETFETDLKDVYLEVELWVGSDTASDWLKVCHRIMQLAISVGEVVSCLWECENHSDEDILINSTEDVFRSSCNLGEAAYAVATRILDHIGAESSVESDSEHREHERDRLLDEMQRIETFRASLKTLQYSNRMLAKRKDNGHRYTKSYQVRRSLDHARAWLLRQRTSEGKDLSESIIHLMYAEATLVEIEEITSIQAEKKYGNNSSVRNVKGRHELHWAVAKLIEDIRKKRKDDEINKTEKQILHDRIHEWKSEHVPESESSPIDIGSVFLGKLEETTLFLNCAERGLTSTNRSSWWMTRLWEDRLLVTRTRLELVVSQLAKMPSEIENALQQGAICDFEIEFESMIRFIRRDLVRLARGIHLFADCMGYMTLLCQISVDNNRSDFMHCIKRMDEVLGSAIHKLNNSCEFQNKIWNSNTYKSPAMCRVVMIYVDEVKKIVDNHRLYANFVVSDS